MKGPPTPRWELKVGEVVFLLLPLPDPEATRQRNHLSTIRSQEQSYVSSRLQQAPSG